ncbi:18200_t:CDS:2 [Rhizophagus irregularis]|nr:18200_t:CDS:2 [Rhizophagus irregularis]
MKLLEEAKAAHAAKVENKSIKPVTPVEMHEYETVNASCVKRLTEKETVAEKYRRTGKPGSYSKGGGGRRRHINK